MQSKIIAWQLTRYMAEEKIAGYESMLDNLMPAIDVGRDPERDLWVLTAFFDAEQQDKAAIISCVGIADSLLSVAGGDLNPVYEEDWKEQAKHSFPPLEIGRFFLHSFDEEVPADMVGLKIPAGLAFGTGEHPTTAGCLSLYDEVLDQNTFKNGLDMGAGSGVLSMAAAKVQGTQFVAIDIDEPSVTTCIENIEVNGTAKYIDCVCGDGFADNRVQEKAPYDLIFANILMKPLLTMAPELVAVLDEGGTTILSGFLTSQEDAILEKYKGLGLTQVGRFEMNNWVALSFIKQ